MHRISVALLAIVMLLFAFGLHAVGAISDQTFFVDATAIGSLWLMCSLVPARFLGMVAISVLACAGTGWLWMTKGAGVIPAQHLVTTFAAMWGIWVTLMVGFGDSLFSHHGTSHNVSYDERPTRYKRLESETSTCGTGETIRYDERPTRYKRLGSETLPSGKARGEMAY